MRPTLAMHSAQRGLLVLAVYYPPQGLLAADYTLGMFLADTARIKLAQLLALVYGLPEIKLRTATSKVTDHSAVLACHSRSCLPITANVRLLLFQQASGISDMRPFLARLFSARPFPARLFPTNQHNLFMRLALLIVVLASSVSAQAVQPWSDPEILTALWP